MKRYTWRLFLVFCLCGILAFLGSRDSFALDPMFELDTKTLGGKNQAGPKAGEPLTREPAEGLSRPKPQTDQSASASPKRKPRVRGEIAQKPSGRGKVSRSVSARKRTKGRRFDQPFSGSIVRSGVKRAKSSKKAPAATVSQSFRIPAVKGQDIQWTREVWDRILQQGRQETAPLVVQERNFSLSLDPERYPVLPAADGGKIVIDEEGTLSPLVKTILREKDPGIRIVTGNPYDRKSFFSSLLAAARFYSVEENFSVDFGTDPKLTVTTDFKIEKTAESLLKNDIVLVNLQGNRKGLPPSLRAFLDKEGFQVVETSPVYSDEPDGQKILYSIEGSGRDSIVDDLYSALSVSCEKNRGLLLDDGALSGVTLSVRADRYSENNNQKVVVSFSEENPVQYTLLRLLELKGYRVVMLNPEDDFKEISEKLLPALGVSAVYGMQHLWKQDGTPFNVQLSGFVVSEGDRSGTRKILTNIPIDPLVEELARYKGFDVIVK
ncbi:peptidoglycan-binding protein LysM [bacterium]|nr:MAG: peptidoglycan-binding protein LysM [bacterium]